MLVLKVAAWHHELLLLLLRVGRTSCWVLLLKGYLLRGEQSLRHLRLHKRLPEVRLHWLRSELRMLLAHHWPSHHRQLLYLVRVASCGNLLLLIIVRILILLATANHLCVGILLLALMIVLGRVGIALRVACWFETLNGGTLGREHSRGCNMCKTVWVNRFRLRLGFTLIWLRLLISSLP